VNPTIAAMHRRVSGALGTPEGAPVAAFFVPGRIEILGKHTDYAGGRSLLCAVEQGFAVAAAPRADAQIRVVDVEGGGDAWFPYDPDLEPTIGHWTNYPMTVVRRLARNFPSARRGADIAFLSNLPPAAGMSSSSAFMIAVFLTMAELNHLANDDAYRSEIRRPEDLSAYLATIENGRSFGRLAGDRGVGTFGGSEDHTAILCCRAGEFAQYAFGPVRRERSLPCPTGYVLVVAASGVVAEKTGGARETYNRVSLAAKSVLDQWVALTGRDDASLEAAATSAPDAPDRIRLAINASSHPAFSPQELRDRFEHFCQESLDLIPRAGDALLAGDLAEFGVLVDRSQLAAETWLGNQVPETIALQRLARELGSVAASAFGAGFGGSVWALIPEPSVEAFIHAWRAGYESAFPSSATRARFIATRPGPGAMAVTGVSSLLSTCW
jgi:galactokinase